MEFLIGNVMYCFPKKSASIVAAFLTTLFASGCALAGQRSDFVEGSAHSSSINSPLDEFLGSSVWHNEQELRRAADSLNTRREDLVAQCMRRAGFEYIPDLHANRWVVGSESVDDTTMPENRELVMRYGFGVVSGDRFISTPGRTGEDPNQEYVESLSDSEQEMYWLTLFGPLITLMYVWLPHDVILGTLVMRATTILPLNKPTCYDYQQGQLIGYR